MKKFRKTCTLFAILLLIAGCGYHIGFIAHPQIKTIAIAPVTNDTMEYNVSANMRAMLAEQFMVDGSLKLKSMEEADCIVYCVIRNVETISTGEDTYDREMTYMPAEWQVQVEAEFQVIIPGRANPLIPPRKLSGYAEYQVMADHATTRSRGVIMACRDLSEKMVSAITEAW